MCDSPYAQELAIDVERAVASRSKENIERERRRIEREHAAAEISDEERNKLIAMLDDAYTCST